MLNKAKHNSRLTQNMLEEEVRCEREIVWEMNRCGQIERD